MTTLFCAHCHAENKMPGKPYEITEFVCADCAEKNDVYASEQYDDGSGACWWEFEIDKA